MSPLMAIVYLGCFQIFIIKYNVINLFVAKSFLFPKIMEIII